MIRNRRTNDQAEKRVSIFGFPQMAEMGSMTVSQFPGRMEFSFEYCDGEEFTLFFRDVSGYRFRREAYISKWHLTNTVDQLVEIENSSWPAELIADSLRPVVRPREMHHYLFCASDHGCYEVLAAAFATAGARVLAPWDDDEPI
ncbi:MAG TPA: hypothetical protein VHC49_06940 [Mycobacteriales bacterium]|nr:hypothetical protein [Mycobacteriales bacterium]